MFPVNFLQTKGPLFNPMHPDVPVGLWEEVGSEEEVRVRSSKTFINGCSLVMSFENGLCLLHSVNTCIALGISQCISFHIPMHLNIRGKSAMSYGCRKKLERRRKSSV